MVILTADTRFERWLDQDPAGAVASVELRGRWPMPGVVLCAGRAELERLRETLTAALADLDARDTSGEDTAGGGS